MGRCAACKRKTGLTGFECRCGLHLCAAHRWPDSHACAFDFSASSSPDLPAVVPDKVPNRL